MPILSTPKSSIVQHGTPQSQAVSSRMEAQSKADDSVPATPKGELGSKRASFIEVHQEMEVVYDLIMSTYLSRARLGLSRL